MKRKEILISLLILLMLTLIAGCAPPVTPVPSGAKEITSYRFEATINPILSSKVEGTIDSDNHTISLIVPYDTPLTSLVATFKLSSGAVAKIGTTPQISSITANDFTSTVNYTVTAEDGSTQDWVVSVEKANPVRYVATDGDDTNEGSEGHPWQTIQYALDTIPAPGTIRVKDGVYNESITFPSNKKIILKSVNSYSFTTIIGDNGSPTVIGSNSLEGTTLEGFTISHNSGDTGRGIEISGGYLNINNCTISHNSTTSHGGGIYNNYGTLTIIASTISYNSASHGGGIYNNYGTLTTTASIISYNSAAYGGGIGNRRGTLTITESTVSHNSALSYGGGIYNWGTLTIIISTISHNSTVVNGGGIRNTGTLTITASTISSNSAASHGGGIYNYGTLTITASTISHNSSNSDGSGIYLDLGSEIPIPTIGGLGEENIICGNYRFGEGPYLYLQIQDDSGSLYDTYKNTNFITEPCPL